MKWIEKTKEYFKNVKIEMQKVSWPTREEIKSSTGIVILTLVLVGFYIGMIDFMLSGVIGILIR